MRLICYVFGYIFVFGGLLSVENRQFDAREVIADTVIERERLMSRGQTYDAGYVHDAVEKAANEVWAKRPQYIKPALLMVAGAVLIDIGARRKQSPKDKPKPQ